MNSTRSILSPTKENNLPTCHGSPSKLQKGQLAQILSFLKENGIKIPPHLNASKNPEDFSLKLHPTEGSSKKNSEVKSLKIKLTDTEFELKKLEEDFAQYKRTVKTEKEKEQKKFEESLQKLKVDSKQNNEDYDFTLDKKKKQNETKIEKLRTEFTQKMERLEKQLTLKHSAELSKLQHKTAGQKESKEIQFNKKYSNLHKELNEQIETLKKEFEREKHNINLRNGEKLDQAQKRFDSTTLALQSEKKTEEKLHQKTKIEAQKEKEKLFGELCYESNVKRNLENEVAARNQEIKELKEKIHELKIELEIVKENAEEEKSWMTKEHEKSVDSIHEKYDEKIRKILESQTAACEKYEKKIEKMDYLHQQSENLHEENLMELSQKFDQRLSKQQDLQEIKKLTNTLTRKDEELRKLTKQLKYRNLEIQNKQEVYNKIFKSSTRMREERKMAVSINKCEYPIPKLQRESWSKESLFRKSQTTDVKMLLQNIGIIKTRREGTIHKDE